MKRLWCGGRRVARALHAVVSWGLVGIVALQTFYVGWAVLVQPGDWRFHTNLGHAIGGAIVVAMLFCAIGWMPARFWLAGLGLYALYSMQYLYLYWPSEAFRFLRAFHAPNALLIFGGALYLARASWRLFAQAGPPRAARLAVILGAGCLVIASGRLAGAGVEQGSGTARPVVLAEATEADVPTAYRTMTSPFPLGDARAREVGRDLVVSRCTVCHGTDLTGQTVGRVEAASLVESARTRSAAFLMWAVSEGSRRGMPAWKAQLTEEERWQVVAFLKSLAGGARPGGTAP
ncbi:MAG: cytochrome c [Firmicutes bacterium]|nr:cytochrome c [Bacillota bacterium]